MKFLFKLFVASLVFCLLTAQVQAHEIEQGQGVFCNTQSQLEQFAAYYDSRSIQEAFEQVNATSPHGCELLRAAFIFGEQVKTVRTKLGTLRVYEVLVVGLWIGQWSKVEPLIQYIAIVDEEVEA